MKISASKDPKTSQEKLKALSKTSAKKQVAQNPNISLSLAANLSVTIPREVAKNPMVPLWELSDPSHPDFEKLIRNILNQEIVDTFGSLDNRKIVAWLWLITREFRVWQVSDRNRYFLIEAIKGRILGNDSVEVLQKINREEIVSIPNSILDTYKYDSQLWAPAVLLGFVFQYEKGISDYTVDWIFNWFNYLEVRQHIQLLHKLKHMTDEQLKEKIQCCMIPGVEAFLSEQDLQLKIVPIGDEWICDLLYLAEFSFRPRK